MATPADDLATAAGMLQKARRLVAFTGAGVSAESGIPTFRDGTGLWETFPPETFAQWDGLVHTALAHPAQLADFLLAVLEPIAVAEPNAAHRALAALERSVPTAVVTQNVDGLHQAAGSTEVREVHGSFLEVVTLKGRLVCRLDRAELRMVVDRLRRVRVGPAKLPRILLALRGLAGPTLHGLTRPNVVLFGEQLAEPDWALAQEDVLGCDVMLVVGTSAEVWPAAELPHLARRNGARLIVVDPGHPGPGGIWIRGPAGQVLPELLRRAFGEAMF